MNLIFGGHLSHCDNSEKREKTKGGGGREAEKIRKTLMLRTAKKKKKNQRPHNTPPSWLQMAATLRRHDLQEPVHV